MCYMVYMSTDCADDLRPLTTDLVRFEKPSKETYSRSPRVLDHQHNWFVGSKSGCSCTFRHLSKGAEQLGFDEPQDWFPEESDGIDATQQLYDVLKSIVERGFHVSLLDCWSGDEDSEATTMEVSLSGIPCKRFRMMEGRLFKLKP
jgi:hypothetical protein